jgi:predicted ferric reductase
MTAARHPSRAHRAFRRRDRPFGRSADPPRRHGRALEVGAPDLLIAISLGAVAVSWWPILLAVRSPGPLRLIPVTAHVCGMLAGYGVLVMLGLMSRSPALERGVGADVLTRWHARGGRLTMTFVLVHAWAAVAGWAQSRHERAAIALWHVTLLPHLLAATVATVILSGVAVMSIRAARRRVSYERWHAIHLLTYIAVALSLMHQLAGPDLSGHRWLQIGWALIYAHVFALLLRHRVLAPLRQAARHRLRVVAVTPEAPGVVSVSVGGQHLLELRAESGQFFRWRFLTPDNWLTAHPFSLSAPPTDTMLRLTVKRLGDGSGSVQQIAVGTWVVVEGPYGVMTAARRTRNDVLLIAGGVGITPMRALLETIPLARGQDLTLLYRARSFDDVVFRSELDEIAGRRGVDVHYLLGEDRSCLALPSLLWHVPDLVLRDVYLCGPPPMADAVRAVLRDAGLPAGQLHEERFAW